MDAVEDIKSRLSIEDVLSQYVELKRSGRNFKGLSPFTSEKTPSFVVSPEKQIWHDFSSGKGGDMFSFVMEMEGLDFKGSLEMLARQAGVDLSSYGQKGTKSSTKQKELILSALEMATKFYQLHLKKNKTALEYIFKKRKFSKQVVLDFRVGYAPDNNDTLVRFLESRGFSTDTIKRAGLSVVRRTGTGDMFRGRIVVPLMDPVGKVIGFTARQIQDDPKAPKYINTPQTQLYDKSRHIFGLHLAKEAIRKNGYVVVVEGNLDVISSHQASVHQVVATAGTAMTTMHLKQLSRLTTDIRLAFDQDDAGLRATERIIPLASQIGVTVSVISIPESKDPDELIKKDPAMWEQSITTYSYAVDWLINRYKNMFDIESAVGKRQFSDKLLPLVNRIEDSVEKDHYTQLLAQLLGISRAALKAKQSAEKINPPKRLRTAKTQPQLNTKLLDFAKIQNHFLALVLSLPSLRLFTNNIRADMLADESARALLAFLLANPDYDDTATEIPRGLKKIDDYVKILRLLYEELYQGLEVLELRYEAARLQTRLIEHYVKKQKLVLAEKMRFANETETTKLLRQAKDLDKLLQSTREV